MDEQYGFPSLAQINRFMRIVLGDNALRKILKEKKKIHIEDASIEKDWNRICRGEYAGSKKSEIFKGEIGSACYLWFEEYECTKKLGSIFYHLILGWYVNLASSECLMTIPEFSTKTFVQRFALEFFFNTYEYFPDSINTKRLLLESCTYETILKNVQESLKLPKLSRLYADFDEKATRIESSSESSEYGRTLRRDVSKNMNPKWKNFKLLIEVYPEHKELLLQQYFINNLKEALFVVFGFSEDDWSKILDLLKSAIEDAVHYPTMEHSFHKILLDLPTLITCDLISVLNNLKASFNSPSVKQYKKYLEDNVPHCCSFLLPWIEGYYEVKKAVAAEEEEGVEGNFVCAMEKYQEAFEYRHMASDFSGLFLCQAISLVLYFNAKKEEKCRRSYSGRIPKAANTYKEYWEVIHPGFGLDLPKTMEDRKIWFKDCFSQNTVQDVISRIIDLTEQKIKEQDCKAVAVHISSSLHR